MFFQMVLSFSSSLLLETDGEVPRRHALTNFYILSSIRSVHGGSSGMQRTSRCFFIKVLQLGGPKTLTAVALFPCIFHIDSCIFSRGREAADFDFSSARFRRFLKARFVSTTRTNRVEHCCTKSGPDYLQPRSGRHHVQSLNGQQACDQRGKLAIQFVAAD